MSPVDFSTRRRFLMHLAQGTALAVLPGELLSENAVLPPPHAPKVENGIAWFDVQSWGVEGRGWASEAMDRFYARLPGKARGVVREPVWNLSQHSAGMLTRFRTDAQEIHVRYKLTSANLICRHACDRGQWHRSLCHGRKSPLAMGGRFSAR
ncbi:MAG: SGNH/GDSL hydrolase N-terminal domain-containing protein [Verrucomicrobiales bacterium]